MKIRVTGTSGTSKDEYRSTLRVYDALGNKLAEVATNSANDIIRYLQYIKRSKYKRELVRQLVESGMTEEQAIWVAEHVERGILEVPE